MERLTYKASEGMTYRRKVDGHIMGNEMYLGLFIDGTEDVIENYEEVVDETYSSQASNSEEGKAPMESFLAKFRKE